MSDAVVAFFWQNGELCSGRADGSVTSLGACQLPGPSSTGHGVVRLPENTTVLIEQQSSAKGSRSHAVVLGVPSEWVLAAQCATTDLPRHGRQEAMAYRLEDALPFAAEEAAVAFCGKSSGENHVLGLAITTALVRPLIEALEAAGWQVISVCPIAWLAAQAALHSREQKGSFSPCSHVAICGGSACDLIELNDHTPVGWYRVPTMHETLQPWLRWQRLQHPAQMYLLTLGAEAAGLSPEDSGEITIESLAVDPLTLATTAAKELINQRMSPWIDLRLGPLAASDPWQRLRPALSRASWAAAALLTVVTLVCLFRGHQYRTVAQEAQQMQLVVFREALPGQRLPASPKLVLESELRRLRGISGQHTDAPRPRPGLQLLYEFLRRLPTELRYRVLEFRIDQNQLYLEGEVRSHGDADLIAAALRRQNGFVLDPPQTQARSNQEGIQFTLQGHYPFSSNAVQHEDAVVLSTVPNSLQVSSTTLASKSISEHVQNPIPSEVLR